MQQEWNEIHALSRRRRLEEDPHRLKNARRL